MSGPIVRKYGFPNFEQIFGKRELEHGVEGKKPVDPLHLDGDQAAEKPATASNEAAASETPRKE